MYILSLARAMRTLGIRVGIATTGGPLVQHCRKWGIPVHVLPPSRGALQATLSAIVSRGGYRAVHANDTASFRWISELKHTQRSLPAIITIHGTYHGREPLRQAAALARRVIVVSPKLAVWARGLGIPGNKTVCIPNGIDTESFRPADTDRWKLRLGLPGRSLVIGYAGRFNGDKLPVARRFIEAAAQVARQRRAAYAVMAGQGKALTSLRRHAAATNARLRRKAIRVHPAMVHVQKLYWASDVMVGTGRVAMEAMACGKPVIAAGTAGYEGVVTPQTLNRAVRSNFGDHSAPGKTTTAALVRDSLRLLRNKQLRIALGRYGRKTVVSRFSLRQVALRLLRIYGAV